MTTIYSKYSSFKIGGLLRFLVLFACEALFESCAVHTSCEHVEILIAGPSEGVVFVPRPPGPSERLHRSLYSDGQRRVSNVLCLVSSYDAFQVDNWKGGSMSVKSSPRYCGASVETNQDRYIPNNKT